MLWALTAISIIGVILNIKKKRLGFVFWIFANGAWAVVNFKAGIPEQGFLFVVYLALAIYGYFAWADEKEPQKCAVSLADENKIL